jgi:hypothetical protein
MILSEWLQISKTTGCSGSVMTRASAALRALLNTKQVLRRPLIMPALCQLNGRASEEND